MNYIEGFIGIGLAFSIMFLIRWIFLGGFKSFPQKSSALLLFIVCIELFYSWAYISDWIRIHPIIIRFNTPFVLLIGPAMYWFIRSFFTPEFLWKKREWLHFVLFIICLIYFTPLYLRDVEFKAAYVNAMINELSFDSYLWGGVRRVQQLIYFSFSGFIVYKGTNKESLRNNLWIVLLVSGFSLIWILDIYRYFFKFDLITGTANSIILSIMSISLIYINLGNKTKVAKPYAGSNLSVRKKNELFERVSIEMENKKSYLDKRLSLSSMSERLNVLPNHISQVVNEKSKMNFNDFVNKFRVEAAKSLLQNSKTTHLTLEAISEESGFNSTSTFNAAFKKHTGHTPKFYRQIKNEV